MKVSTSAHLVLVCLVCARVNGSLLEITYPQDEEMVRVDVIDLQFVVRPNLVDLAIHPSVLILLDGQQLAIQEVDQSACDRDHCAFSVPVRGIQEGPHVFNLLLLETAAPLSELEDGNVLAESAATFERHANEVEEVGQEDDNKHRDLSTSGIRIVFLSPRGNFSSFLDPHNVHIRFRVENFDIPSAGNAELEVSGTVVASGFRNSEPSVALPSMAVRDYSASVFLTDVHGKRNGIHSMVAFHVWPDHSWVRSHNAAGQGLSLARTGESASFVITARERTGAEQTRGGAWYVVRLEGPAVVVGAVTDMKDGTYQASYFAAEEGSYQLSVVLHYTDGAGLQDYGDEDPQDVIGWHIQGSPFTVAVRPPASPSPFPLNPYSPVPLCAANDLAVPPHAVGDRQRSGKEAGGRWVRADVCKDRGLECRGGRQADDEWVWLPWKCAVRDIGAREIKEWWEREEHPRILMAGSSQQRTLFFDVAKILESTQNQPRKYWTDLEATDVSPNLFFHWMVPEYDMEGYLDYTLLLEGLTAWLQKHLSKPQDVLIIQLSVHDIHFGSLAEYPAHMATLARYLESVPCRVLFRSGDALHIPPGGRHIIERGLRDPRMQAVNLAAADAMAKVNISVLDTHSPSLGRPDKTLDGYHYFDRHTEELDAAGVEVCIGNSVARTLANLILHAVCDAAR